MKPQKVYCKHTDCKRKTDYKDNSLGYCNKCLQLPAKRCLDCLIGENK